MKYTITGGAGHISKPLAEKLLNAGHEVTLIGRSLDNLKDLVAKGAKAAVGSVEDTAFLTMAFTGADAVYTMVPPNMGATDWIGYIKQIGKNYAEALTTANIKYVVNLSSVGAHMPDGAGPVSGLHFVELDLNELPNVNVKHLRPGFFYQNLLSNVGLIKNMNIMGANYGPDVKMALVDPSDIAEAAASALLKLDFKGHSILYVSSDEVVTTDIAKVLGTAIGKPELPWVEFSDEQSFGGMKGAGLSAEIAKNYTEMGGAVRSGNMLSEYWKEHPVVTGKTKIEDFARVFAAVYNAN